MTSGEFTSIPLSSIVVNRAERQRRELPGIEELAESIGKVGLINPLIVTRDYVLVAGERRLTAMQHLGWTDALVQFADTLDPLELHLIELEENIKRVDLTWQERTNAIAEYHRLRGKDNPEHSVEDTAVAMGMTARHVHRSIFVADGIAAEPELAKAEAFSTALSALTRKRERTASAAIRELAEETAPGEAPRRYAALLHEDFLEWAKQPQQVPFNLLHVDFPYGISTGDKIGQSAAKGFGTYADSADIYWGLLNALIQHQDNFIAPKAHMVFWFSMKYYSETMRLLTGAGWSVLYMPLIWGKSDNAGILPDANRGPRFNYETALLCIRGDAKIIKAVSNIFWGPTTKEFHTSEKSYAMLEHFFRMLVDDTTRLLDPTCGSGMAIKAAEACGASFALGLEKDADFYAAACDNLKLWEESK